MRYLHTAILVTNLQRAEQFYGSLLGLVRVDRDLKFPGIWYQVGEVEIHLIAAAQVHPDLADADKWGRNPHLAFAVENLADLKEQLLAQGYPIQMSASGRAALFTRDPDGNIIELNQAYNE
jgi:catechol 2,3-dioxygenase-like lactoylglutathione lyase family enzyme